MSIAYQLTSDGTHQTLTVLHPQGRGSRVVPDTHPRFQRALAVAQNQDATWDDLTRLLDVREEVTTALGKLSHHVGFDGTHITWDGDKVDTALSRHLARLLRAGDQGYRSLVAFMERLAANPSQRSRVHLWTWLHDRDFTLTPDGLILAYKGVRDDGANRSIHYGAETVLVDGVKHQGHIPNPPGATISIARSLVNTDRSQGCSRGLHVGTWQYASGFGQGVVLRVLVDPADVVSVPRDAEFQKMRVCAYTVLDATTEQCTDATWFPDDDEDDDEDDDWAA